MDFSSACWSDCSWDAFAFSPDNTMWQRVPQFCHLLCEQGRKHLVLNLLLDGIMWSLTLLCSHSPCPSETADPSYLSLTVSFPGWRDLVCFIFLPHGEIILYFLLPYSFFLYLFCFNISPFSDQLCPHQSSHRPTTSLYHYEHIDSDVLYF